MKKLLIFGGSFNPIHNGHKDVLIEAIKQIKPDLTLVIPNFISPFKKENIEIIHKKNMINIFLKDFENMNVKLDEFEINKNKKSYFIDTVKYVKQKYADYDIYTLIGSDLLIDFNKWKDYEIILSNIKSLVVAKRRLSETKFQKAQSFIKKHKDKIMFLKNYQGLNISSTRIRETKIYNYDLNFDILSYINKNGLYAYDRILKTCSTQRVQHSLRVVYYAEQLCKKHNLSEDILSKAKVAGIYHDIAKNFDNELTLNYFRLTGFDDNIHVKTMHGYVGAYILENDFLINDKEILQAIRRHTLPFKFFSNPPSLLDKIIYLADKLEYNRTDKDVNIKPIDYYRELSFKDINQAFNELIEDFKHAKYE